MIELTQGSIIERGFRIKVGSGLSLTQDTDGIPVVDTAAAYGITEAQADIRYIQKTGGTMTGLFEMKSGTGIKDASYDAGMFADPTYLYLGNYATGAGLWIAHATGMLQMNNVLTYMVQSGAGDGRSLEAYYGSGANRTFNIGINRSSGDAWIGWNARQGSGDTQVYAVSNYAARISSTAGLKFLVAASGTGGGTISWVNALEISDTALMTVYGKIVATAKGHTFGSATGTAGDYANANLYLYNNTSTNWAGIGTDTSGSMWFKTGISGTGFTAIFDFTGVWTFPGNVLVGSIAGAGTSTATPIRLSLGDTYASTLGDAAKTKFRIFENNAGTIYGFGVSNGFLELHLPATAGWRWYVANVEKFRIANTGESQFAAAVTISDISQSQFKVEYPVGPTDAKKWWQQVLSDGTWRLRAINDAESGGINALSIARSGVAAVTLTLGGGTTITGGLSLTSASNNSTMMQERAFIWTSDGTQSGTIRSGIYGQSSSNFVVGIGSGLTTAFSIAGTLAATFTGTVNGTAFAMAGLTPSTGWFLAANTKGLLVQNSGGSNKVALQLDGSNIWQMGDGLAVALTGPTITPSVASTYALNIGGNFSFGIDASNAFIQTWGSRTLWLNNQGNAVTVGGVFKQIGLGISVRNSGDTAYVVAMGSVLWWSGGGSSTDGAIATSGGILRFYQNSSAPAFSLTSSTAVFAGTITATQAIIDNGAGGAYGLFGSRTAAAGIGVGIQLFPGSAHKSWLIGAQINVADVLEFIPSTANGGNTFSTAAMTLSPLGLLTTAASINAAQQLRATGWWTSGDSVGLGAEIGVSAAQVYFIAYNRTSSTYGVMNFSATAYYFATGDITAHDFIFT